MSKPIIDFQHLLTGYFRDLVLATAYLEIGSRTIAGTSENASVQLTIASDVVTEPMYLRELLPHSARVGLGIAELFQSKAMAAWADLLNALFENFVALHMEGKRQFPKFKRRTTKLDFSSPKNFKDQVREGLVTDFAFKNYRDRIQTITDVLSSDDRQLAVIRKHVAIRNATQHHGGQVYEEMLKELGIETVELLNHASNPMALSLGQRIALYVPELDRLKKAFFLVTNQWREQLGKSADGSNT